MVRAYLSTRVLSSSSRLFSARSSKAKFEGSSQNKRKKKKKVLGERVGAHLVTPRIFGSAGEHNAYFKKFADANLYTSSMFTFTTITHHTSDTAHPLVMLTSREGHRYLFGKIPEGSQRVLNEGRIRLGKLRGIFLTGILLSWSQIGGLPGLFLTISDATKKDIDLYSNSSSLLTYLVSTWRYFVFRKGVQMNIKDTTDSEFIADSTMVVMPIRIHSDNQTKTRNGVSGSVSTLKKLMSMMFPSDTSAVNDPDPASYKSDPSETEIQTHVELPDPGMLNLVQDQPAVSYLIRFMPIRGKFDPAKAKALGIKPGYDYRALTQGSVVYNAEGVAVHPHQVIEPSKHFEKALIMDIPNASYLHATLQSNDFFEKNNETGEENIGVVYHFLGDDVNFELETYKSLLDKFPVSCKHIISHPKLGKDVVVFKKAAENLIKLKSLQQECFNLPFLCDEQESTPPGGAYRLHMQQQVVVSPEEIVHEYSMDAIENCGDLYDAIATPGNFELPEKAGFLALKPVPLSSPHDALRDQVQVYTLGTGSALPSIYRNVISTLLRVPYSRDGQVEFRSIILDGGENTLGAMSRIFGHGQEGKIQEIFEELSLIHLSHLHADHHLGLVSIINEWFKYNSKSEKKLYLITPWQYNNFLLEWYRLESHFLENVDIGRIRYLSCEEFLRDRTQEYKQLSIQEFEESFDRNETRRQIPKRALSPRKAEMIDELYRDLKLSKVNTCKAIHCFWAYSISLEFQLDLEQTFKVSYSGDTRPNPRFVEIGYGSDLLIHESTLDHQLIEEALAKKHSTMIEAIEMSRIMNCGHLILTHFSTRYSGSANFLLEQDTLEKFALSLRGYLHRTGATPNIFDEGLRSSQSVRSFSDIVVCFAFDMMIVTLRTMAQQKDYIGKILEIFQGDEDEDELARAARDAKKKEEKQEEKRLQRLALSGQKKRRVDANEPSS